MTSYFSMIFFAISTIFCRLLLLPLIVSLASLLQTSFHVSDRSSFSYCWRVWKGFITKYIIQPNSPLLQVFVARTCSVYCLLRSEKYEFCSVLFCKGSWGSLQHRVLFFSRNAVLNKVTHYRSFRRAYGFSGSLTVFRRSQICEQRILASSFLSVYVEHLRCG
jgi:hypothetical protein